MRLESTSLAENAFIQRDEAITAIVYGVHEMSRVGVSKTFSLQAPKNAVVNDIGHKRVADTSSVSIFLIRKSEDLVVAVDERNLWPRHFELITDGRIFHPPLFAR